MKKNSKIVLIVVLGLIAITLLGVGFLVVRNMIDEKNTQMGKKDGSRPMFYTDAGQEVEFAISSISDQMEKGSIVSNQDAFVNISLQNNYNATSVCTYDIFWEWSDTAYGYHKTQGKQNELTISGEIDDIKLFEEIQLNDYNLANPRTLLGSYYVMNEGNSITPLTLKTNIKFYKLDGNQDVHKDKSYVGKLVVDNIRCSAAEKLKDKDLSSNNYVCLSHSNNPYCPEDKLYQVLELTSSGIKIVRTKDYGTTSWQDTLLNDGLADYIKSSLNDYQKIILDYQWPVPEYFNNNISLDEALTLEENAKTNIMAKVGLLSYSDILKHDYLKDYDTPYLLLGGGTYTKGGFSKEGRLGLVYPCLYLDTDVVTSRGNGTISSPYYIN